MTVRRHSQQKKTEQEKQDQKDFNSPPPPLQSSRCYRLCNSPFFFYILINTELKLFCVTRKSEPKFLSVQKSFDFILNISCLLGAVLVIVVFFQPATVVNYPRIFYDPLLHHRVILLIQQALEAWLNGQKLFRNQELILSLKDYA